MKIKNLTFSRNYFFAITTAITGVDTTHPGGSVEFGFFAVLESKYVAHYWGEDPFYHREQKTRRTKA